MSKLYTWASMPAVWQVCIYIGSKGEWCVWWHAFHGLQAI